jgi:N-acetylglucosamine-6-phosphate deacetylase
MRGMTRFAIVTERAFTPLEEIPEAVVLVEDERIRAIGRREAVALPPGTAEFDARKMTAVPGFVDLHIHGAGGCDLMEEGVEALPTVAFTAAKHGTTALVATTVTASEDRSCRSLRGLARYVSSEGNRHPPAARRQPVAEILGVHLEGPFINPVRRGVQPEEWIRPPSLELLERLLEAAEGSALILTLAPEMPGGLELIEQARRLGLVVSLGHTDATYEQARQAIERGASHAAHVFNAMRPFAHRDTGVIGAVLTSPEVTAEVIADGVHVDAPAIRLLVTAKGAERVVLVSDGTAATAMPDGRYRLGTLEINVAGGVARDDAGRLAGSTLTLDRALRQVVGLGVPLRDALRMATLNPAARLGLEARKGVLAPGADADLVLLTSELYVAGAMTRGSGLAGFSKRPARG